MAFASFIRKSAASLGPAANRLARSRLNFQTSATSAVLNRANLARKPSRSCFLPRAFGYSTASEKPSSDQALLHVIESEIKCAEETDDHEVVEGIPEGFPFKIEDNPGHQTVTLSREFDGEQVKVEVNMPALVTGENEDEMEADDEGPNEKPSESSIPLVVTITKKSGLGLEFSCMAFPDEVAIQALAVRHPEGSPEEQISYEGPDFHDLDENLRKSFHKYLEIRGIKPSTTNFLHEYMINKDSREYKLWMKKLKDFIQE